MARIVSISGNKPPVLLCYQYRSLSRSLATYNRARLDIENRNPLIMDRFVDNAGGWGRSQERPAAASALYT